MDVERSSLCNCVVNFLLEENYLLTAFELLHELLDDGRDAQAIRLKEFFSDPSQFPPEQITRFNSLKVADPQTLLEEKETLQEKVAICEYELRLAQEDALKFKTELQKLSGPPLIEPSGENGYVSLNAPVDLKQHRGDNAQFHLGPLKENERKDLNSAVKEYLLLAGYRLTAMTFYEEVTDQNLDVCPKSPAVVTDALRRYYYQYLSSTEQAAEEKIAMLKENESLRKANEKLNHEKESLLKSKELADGQITALTKSMDSLQKDLKDKEIQVKKMKQFVGAQRQELNGCRAEITSLKMRIEGLRANKDLSSDGNDGMLSGVSENKMEEVGSEGTDTKYIKEQSSDGEEVLKKEMDVDISVSSTSDNFSAEVINDKDLQPEVPQRDELKEFQLPLSKISSASNSEKEKGVGFPSGELSGGDGGTPLADNFIMQASPAKMGLETIQILSDSLPKIVPYVLINHREELLPLIMCAIERHPDSSMRDSLTHTLFNLIKRPDEQQRRIIMDACVSLAKNVGEMRTETELLPQCWEQINHMYEERRLLVAQSCGELAEFVRPEIRDSLILSIVQQLVEDSATVVREAAAHNLSLLLPLFPNTEKYFKVEELMFQLVCDPAGVVVDTTLKELVPALIKWGNKLDSVLRSLLSHVLGSVQRCPPLSGVEGSVESHLRVLGERERWNIDILLRMLIDLVPYVYHKTIETCPFASASDSSGVLFSTSLLELYAGGHVEWSVFEWMHMECFPGLIELACHLPQKEDSLRNRMTKFLLIVAEQYGNCYLTHTMLPVFMVSVGDKADLSYFPSTTRVKVEGLKPKGVVAERLATACVMPILLAGVLGAPIKREQLAEYLRKLLVQNTMDSSHRLNAEIIDAVRFLCTFSEHHSMIFNILWEMVVSSNNSMKIGAAKLFKVMVPYVDAKMVSTQVLPALVTLGSDQSTSVKYASIDAFGSVAQHFKNDTIVDKIRVQMDAFLEDGSHEATIAVVRALVVAVPHTIDKLRDYLLSKISQFTASPNALNDITRRRERADAFCEAIRALDATDISATSIREFLLPAIQNLLKDLDALDPAHKEALEIILKERSGGTFETISKVMGMGSHLGIASSVSSFFGEKSGLLSKKDSGESSPQSPPGATAAVNEPPTPVPPQQAAEDTRFRRIMRGGLSEMLRANKTKSSEDTSKS